MEVAAPAPVPVQPSMPTARDRVASWLLYAAAASLLVVAITHAASWFTASLAVDNNGLTPYYRKAFRGLWLGFSLQTAAMALVVLIAGLRPRSISRPVVALCGLVPLLGGMLVALSVESLGGELFLLVSALLVAAGAFLRHPGPKSGPDTPRKPA